MQMAVSVSSYVPQRSPLAVSAHKPVEKGARHLLRLRLCGVYEVAPLHGRCWRQVLLRRPIRVQVLPDGRPADGPHIGCLQLR